MAQGNPVLALEFQALLADDSAGVQWHVIAEWDRGVRQMRCLASPGGLPTVVPAGLAPPRLAMEARSAGAFASSSSPSFALSATLAHCPTGACTNGVELQCVSGIITPEVLLLQPDHSQKE
jgi:hypothetical protein